MKFTAFLGHTRLAHGSPLEVAAAVLGARLNAATPILVFDDATASQVDLDLRGTAEGVLARYRATTESPDAVADGIPSSSSATARGPGRPRLGVVAREVTLLPQHWEWLGQQPGGASVALRKLVDQARRAGADKLRTQKAREAAYAFLYAVGGNLPNYDEVSRALFAGDQAQLEELTAPWPPDVRTYLLARLAD